jgi:hypothetical protein
MNRKRLSFPWLEVWAFAAFFVLGSGLFPVPVFAQTEENNWGWDDEGKAVAAVLSLAGEEPEMSLRFHDGIMESVAALEKYSPREVEVPAGMRIPTDMPPISSLTSGARYALTGGVYPGEEAGEYYLQLWLWDMAGATMIYTDDLVYGDIDEALESLPGLVEWLFSHIHEAVIETPAPETWRDPFFMLGVRAGVSQRWYVKPNEVSPGASALNPEGGVSGALRLNSLFSLQLELLLTGDNLVYRGLNLVSTPPVMENQKSTNLSLEIPLLFKMNFRAGSIRLSPLAGLYAMIPLGKTAYHSTKGEDESHSWSSSFPLGFAMGFEGAAQYGPGKIFTGLRYSADFGDLSIDDGRGRSYRRHIFSLYVGYEFGFFD